MKIVTSSKQVFGKKLNVPFDGTVEVSEEGILEVSDKCADVLLKQPNFSEIAKPAAKASKSAKKEEDEDDEDSDGLDDLELEDLIKLAVEASYPDEEFKNFKKNKKLMLKYLRKKSSEEEK
jgi:hypothetical protein